MAKRAAPHRGIDVHYGGDTGTQPQPQPQLNSSGIDGDIDDSTDGDDTPRAERPSKTQLKQQSHALQTLGQQLAALSAERLARVEMPEALRDAIDQYGKTRSHEGRRRQLQYVGKLMRAADEAVLREAVAEAALGSAKETLLLHHAEHWRAELIASDDALTRWLHDHPDTDTQQLRSLVRAARREAALPPEQRQPRIYRELFQFIKPHLGNAA